MEYYINEIKQTLEDLASELSMSRDDRTILLVNWLNGETNNDFGNVDGSRFCNAHEAQETLHAAGFPWDYDLNQLIKDAGFEMGDLVDKGAEAVDVVICELLAPRVAEELLEGMGYEVYAGMIGWPAKKVEA